MPADIRFPRAVLRAIQCVVAVAACAGAIAASADDAYRRLIEDDWRKQDERRLNEIRRPGLVRFPKEELQWPGVQGQSLGAGLTLPQAAAPKIDGRLDDACWKDAVQPPPGPGDHPVVPIYKLARDARHVYVAATFPTAAEANFYPASAALDAGGAVDGVKNGRYAFHTNLEPNPWWQVDLGQRQPIARIVVYNRLDYEPGIHNADNLVVLVSDDGQLWTKRYDNQGKHFGGAGRGKPLEIAMDKEKLEARFVRLQIPSQAPIFFHLDEVEVYGPADPPDRRGSPTPPKGPTDRRGSPTPPKGPTEGLPSASRTGAEKNLALKRPALQSSTSTWSKGGPLCELGSSKVYLDGPEESAGVAVDGKRLAPEAAQVRREAGQTCVEMALPLGPEPGAAPSAFTAYHGKPAPIAVAGELAIGWPEPLRLGFGRNRLALEVRSARPLDPDAELTVETMVFTQHGPVRQAAFRQKPAAPGPVTVEFQLADEGAAAVIATLRQGGTTLSDGRAFFVAPVRETLRRAERLCGAGVAPARAVATASLPTSAGGTPAPQALADLAQKAEALAAREAADGPDPEARHALYHQARWLARELAFKTRLDFDKLLVVKRFCQETYPDVCLNHMPWCSRPGGDVCVVSLGRCDEPGQASPVIGGRLGPGRVHGMDLWFDADRIVFGWAKSRTGEPPAGWLDRRTSYELRRTEEPTHLFEMRLDGTGLKQLTSGEWSDIDPTYLPSGEIAFVSERCGYSLQCNELDKDETSTNLYVMRPDGSSVRRLSVTKDGDYLPHTLDDGTIAYTRWEYQERGWANIQSVWIVRPDGTGADALFKQHFNDPWALEDTRSIPGSKKLVATATGHHTLPAGPVVRIDVRHGMNNPTGIEIVTPGVVPPEGGMSGRCVDEGGVRGIGGYYMNPWALAEGAFLAAYAYCGGRVTGVATEIDPAGYGIYLIGADGTKELVYRDPDISCFTPIPLRPRTRPPVLPDLTDPAVKYAVCSVADVGRGVEGVDPKAIRYIRVGRRLPWPYDNTHGGHRYEPDVKGVMINWTPAEVIGLVPVEPDGSAHFTVPVDKAVYFQLLDENFMELRRMRSFISFQPGERRACTGCHESREQTSHHAVTPFPMALAKEPVAPQAPPWGAGAMSFLRDVQPVLDKHCAGCHGGLKPAAGMDFTGGLTGRYNRAYDTILANKLVSRSNVGDDARITQPLAFGSHKSRLVEAMRSGACSQRAKLSPEDWLRLVTWIDLNGPYHDGFINKRPDAPPYDLPGDQDLLGKLAAVHARRCAGCHQPAEVTRLDWIDLNKPEASRFLAAPLAKQSGGTGRCGDAVYKNAADADYQAALGLVRAAADEAWKRPRRDLRPLGRPDQPR